MDLKRKLLLTALGVTLPLSAFAYVDPGSGMMMLQGLIALIGAIVVFVRNPVAAFKRLIERIKRK